MKTSRRALSAEEPSKIFQAGLLAWPCDDGDLLALEQRNGVEQRRQHTGLTVAVTTRDLHPLPYSPAAVTGNEHLKVMKRAFSKFRRHANTRLQQWSTRREN